MEFNYNLFTEKLKKNSMEKWINPLNHAIETALKKPDGNMPFWDKTLEELPIVENCKLIKNEKAITIISDDNNGDYSKRIEDILKKLIPWRKGPFKIFNTYIDSEWRSDMKWDRVLPNIKPLKGKNVLDIGCGNGYHMFRMAEEGADLVIGVDPTMLFYTQFMAINKYVQRDNVFLLPLGFEDLPSDINVFDTVFAMGVLYHRKSPFEFLKSLKSFLKPCGELVLETLIVDGDENTVMVPQDRYASMKNVWFLPSAKAMIKWLKRIGFTSVKFCGSQITTTEEQRCTQWMLGKSLSDFLDANNKLLTIEGLPAPNRGIFIASNGN